MKLRFATLADAEQILDIYTPYILHTAVTFEYEVPSLEAFRARMERTMDQGRYPYLVCEDRGRLAGYAYAHPFAERAAYGWSVELSVYIAGDYQRRGVASVLYGALLKLLTAQGYQMAYAIIGTPNETSEAFHRALGFQPCGELHCSGFKLGEWRDTLYYEKPLQEVFETPAPPQPLDALPPELAESIFARGEAMLEG